MTVRAHVRVDTPQSAGVIVTPGDPAATTDAGIAAVLLLVTEKCTAPKPLTVNGYEGEPVPAASEASAGSAVIVGAGNVPKAPIASIRP